MKYICQVVVTLKIEVAIEADTENDAKDVSVKHVNERLFHDYSDMEICDEDIACLAVQPKA